MSLIRTEVLESEFFLFLRRGNWAVEAHRQDKISCRVLDSWQYIYHRDIEAFLQETHKQVVV